jgi:hypothetical protein
MQASLIRLDHVCDGMPSLQSSVKDAAATMAHDLRSDLDDSKTPADLLLLPPNCRVTFNGTTDELTDALAPAVATTYETYVPLKKLVADLPRKILSINDAYDSRERTRLTLQVDRPCGERVRRRGGGGELLKRMPSLHCAGGQGGPSKPRRLVQIKEGTHERSQAHRESPAEGPMNCRFLRLLFITSLGRNCNRLFDADLWTIIHHFRATSRD